MWADEFTNPIQGRAFRKVRVEPMNLPVDYKEEITCEYVFNTIGVSETNGVQTDNPNALYIPYAEATRATNKSYINSL